MKNKIDKQILMKKKKENKKRKGNRIKKNTIKLKKKKLYTYICKTNKSDLRQQIKAGQKKHTQEQPRAKLPRAKGL